MRVLLDTHAFVWWVEDRELLSRRAKEMIENPETLVFVSAASAWELAIKVRIGKFRSRELVAGFSAEVHKEGFIDLPISIDHALRAGGLDSVHKDPFDRMLVAQAQIEDTPIISSDRLFDSFSLRRIW